MQLIKHFKMEMIMGTSPATMVVDTVVTVVVVVMVVEVAIVVVAVVMAPQRVMIPVREAMTTRGMESQKS